MATMIDICNRALFHVGANLITDIDSSDESAVACRLFFEQSLRKALRDHPWGFALTAIPLSPLATQGTVLNLNYTYAYSYPFDCVYPVEIVNPRGREDKTIEYKVQGNAILTNEPDAVLSYVAATSASNVKDESFLEMLEYLLAAKIGLRLTGNADKVKYLEAKYKELRDEAEARSSNESFEEPKFYNSFIEVRHS